LRTLGWSSRPCLGYKKNKSVGSASAGRATGSGGMSRTVSPDGSEHPATDRSSFTLALMSTSVKQALVLALGGGLIVLVILGLARRRLLTTRYALGWLGVGLLVALAALTMPFVGRLGKVANITPTAVLLMISSV